MEEKKSAALQGAEQLIECLDEHIRNIVKDELDRRAWDNLRAIYPPEFVQGLEKIMSASLERMSESGILENSGKNSEQ